MAISHPSEASACKINFFVLLPVSYQIKGNASACKINFFVLLPGREIRLVGSLG
ncbi:MAG: hypothetical protein Q8S04_08230 [Bacteroidales bacterium]|nr:hypothetical protein [Bacteroidales bacterium]